MTEILSLIAKLESETQGEGPVTPAQAAWFLILAAAMVVGFWMILGPAATTRLLIEVGTVAVTAVLGAFTVRKLSRS